MLSRTQIAISRAALPDSISVELDLIFPSILLRCSATPGRTPISIRSTPLIVVLLTVTFMFVFPFVWQEKRQGQPHTGRTKAQRKSLPTADRRWMNDFLTAGRQEAHSASTRRFLCNPPVARRMQKKSRFARRLVPCRTRTDRCHWPFRARPSEYIANRDKKKDRMQRSTTELPRPAAPRKERSNAVCRRVLDSNQRPLHAVRKV